MGGTPDPECEQVVPALALDPSRKLSGPSSTSSSLTTSSKRPWSIEALFIHIEASELDQTVFHNFFEE